MNCLVLSWSPAGGIERDFRNYRTGEILWNKKSKISGSNHLQYDSNGVPTVQVCMGSGGPKNEQFLTVTLLKFTDIH